MAFLVLQHGIAGLERLSKILMPALVIMVGLLAIYSLTLSGGAKAMAFYTAFDWARFLDPHTWRPDRRSSPWVSAPEY